MQGFRSPGSLQHFVSIFSALRNLRPKPPKSVRRRHPKSSPPCVRAVVLRDGNRSLRIQKQRPVAPNRLNLIRPFNGLAREFFTGDVDLLAIACTELSLLVDGLDTSITKIDALDVLVAAIVERAG